MTTNHSRTAEGAAAEYLSRFRWYAPYNNWTVTDDDDANTEATVNTEESRLLSTRDEPQTPSLGKAWSYFETMVLPRRFCEDSGEIAVQPNESMTLETILDYGIGIGNSQTTTKGKNVLSERGELAGAPTELYDPRKITVEELADFGIGIGLYFSTLRAIAMVMLVAFLLHLPNYVYFRSSSYSRTGQSGLAHLLRGSAVCTDKAWVPCPACNGFLDDDTTSHNDPSHVLAPDQLRYTHRISTSAKGLVFALKNTCGTVTDDPDYLYQRGMVGWVGSVFVAIALLGLGEHQRRLAVKFDERNATASDFSVAIKNPPPTATDPDEWKAFLEGLVQRRSCGNDETTLTARDAHVTLVTVALDNWQLLDALVARRQLRETARVKLGMGPEAFEAAVGSQNDDHHPILEKTRKIDRRIRMLEKQEYHAKRIFASFETERGQRAALTALNASKINVWKNKAHDESVLFRGRVLEAEEPTEPLTVRWRDLGVPVRLRVGRRAVTSCISLVLVLGAFWSVRFAWNRFGPEAAALLITVLNILTPPVCRLTTGLEVHSKEGSKQASHSLKVLGLRCINSAVIIHLVTPFAWSLEEGDHLVKAVATVFFAEMLTAPVLQVLDIGGKIKRHVVAPRCRDQESMNLNFTGTRWELSERYTNMMKTCFLCFFFSALYPLAFGLTALLLCIHYEADKYCILRIWARVPSLGSQVAELNRSYVVPALLVTLATMNAYSWSGFPYDDLCPSEDPLPESYRGEHTLVVPSGETITVNVGTSSESVPTTVYEACNQDFLAYYPIVFPPLPMFQDMRWMSDGQEKIVRLHGWTSVAMIGIVVLYVLLNSKFSEFLVSIVRGNYKPSGEIDGTDLSDIPGSVFSAYVPQVTVKGFRFPLIACDVRGLGQRFIGWLDEDGDVSEHVLFGDVAPELTEDESKPIFSIVKHWNPPDKKQ